MSEFYVSIMESGDEAKYTRFLNSVDESLLYSSLKYRNFLLDLLNCDHSYLIARNLHGEIFGGMPVMSKDGPLGRVINSLPFYGSNGGIVSNSIAASEAIARAFEKMVDDPKTAAAVWIEHPFRKAPIMPSGATIFDERISQITFLPNGPDPKAELLSLIDSSARRNIQKAAREGISIRVANDHIEFLEKTHNENMAVIKGNAKSKLFFSLIEKHFEADKDYKIWLAEKDGRPLAALLLFYFNNTVEYFTPVISAHARDLQPMALILEKSMLHAACGGFKYWNWGGTWLTQQGVLKFKKKWGAVESIYRYHISLNNKAILKLNPQDILSYYPNFFTVPFNMLAGGT